jgi:hypothetical protein
MHRLRAALARANGRAVFIVGERGSGKTHLIEQFARRSSRTFESAFLINGDDLGQRLETVRAIAENAKRKILVAVDDLEGDDIDDRLQQLQAARLGNKVALVVATTVRPRVEDFRILPMPPVNIEKLATIFGGSLDFLRPYFARHPVADMLAFAEDNGRIVVKPAMPDIAIALIEPAGAIVRVIPQIIVPFIQSPLSAAIDELEHLINRSDVREMELQKFMEAHPEFLTGLEYDQLFPQVALERLDNGPLVPDFLLKLIGKSEVDLLDLKLPGAKRISGKKDRLRFSQVVQDGIAQLREYRDHFDNPPYRQALMRKLGVTAYLPRATLVIGRMIDGTDAEKTKQIAETLPPFLRLLTYDEIVARMRQLSKMIAR